MKDHNKFLERYHTKKFLKGELIMVQGEIPPCVYVINKGVVKVYNLTSQGEEKPISYDMEGESFPLGWAFSKMTESQFFYDAFTDVELYCVPRREFQDLFSQNADVLYSAHINLVSNYVYMQTRINALEQSKAANKVANTVHYLCLRYGKDIKTNVVRIGLPMTQQEMANFMGLTRETTGIELKKLQKAGVLTYRRQSYIVDTNKLNDILDDDYEQARMN